MSQSVVVDHPGKLLSFEVVAVVLKKSVCGVEVSQEIDWVVSIENPVHVGGIDVGESGRGVACCNCNWSCNGLYRRCHEVLVKMVVYLCLYCLFNGYCNACMAFVNFIGFKYIVVEYFNGFVVYCRCLVQ